MAECKACGKEITECPECEGKLCEPGCPDREEDGCTCGEEAEGEELM